MLDKENIMSLGQVLDIKIKQPKHTSSTIQADTLFTFTTKLKYLLPFIQEKMITPRYCVENIEYLKIKDLKSLAYPMRCFCDINMHRLDFHLQWYGYYGIAFKKEWGMSKGMQPIQYINPTSELCKDFSKAFSAALKLQEGKASSPQTKIKNFLLHELMYYKPYEGKMENRNTKKIENKCFTDECEWRFIPNVSIADFPQVLHNEKVVLQEFNEALKGLPSVSLQFEYDDVKYIIVKTQEDFNILIQEIEKLEIDTLEKNKLISKIIIWDESGRDF